MENNQIRGTFLLANEGINGTVAGLRSGMDNLLTWLKADPRMTALTYKESYNDALPFYRTKVKLKKEIVTMGVDNINPSQMTGTYVKPQNWNTLISDPEVTVIDTRNDYEVKTGTFKHAINPQTKSFRDFPRYCKKKLNPDKHKKIAMFCTGGIRCEKSSAWLKSQGFDQVYHLQGGILKYLEEIPEERSLWQGECFVFDQRVTVQHGLAKGHFDQCHACRMPITEQDKNHAQYCPGVSCHYCYQHTSSQQRRRFKERQKQIQLAKQRGESHIGDTK